MTDATANPLTDIDLAELTALRHELHRRPELSGEEEATARRIREALLPTGPDEIIAGLGGHGLAAVWTGAAPGPTVMVRAELDALPIQELGDTPHRSETDGTAHLCGHDGHATILVGLARLLGRQRPATGRVVLMFQPAEETGAGAAAVTADPRFQAIRPDWAFALHNMPGLPLGTARIGPGPANCASRGLRIRLNGTTAHASQPETGRSPMPAVARIMPALEALGPRGPLGDDFSMVTVTHASMGAPAYGVAPGEAEIRATLRTVRDDRMQALCDRAERLVRDTAAAQGLEVDLAYDDVFVASVNDPEAAALLHEGATRAGLATEPMETPWRASEDFGLFGHASRSAMLFLGAGESHPDLHTPAYDFPDALIATGIRLFRETLAAGPGGAA